MVEDSSPKYLREDTGKTKKTYDGFKEEDNAQLLNNLTSWLSKKEATPNLAKSGVKLDKATVLHDFEQPQNSTEPQKNHGHNHLKVIIGTIDQRLRLVVMAVQNLLKMMVINNQETNRLCKM